MALPVIQHVTASVRSTSADVPPSRNLNGQDGVLGILSAVQPIGYGRIQLSLSLEPGTSIL
jgi:hypothetical protein